MGANIGIYSIFAGYVSDVKVYSFEPESNNFQILMENILDLFSKYPKLKKINRGIPPNEGYIKSLREDEKSLKSKNNSGII